MARPSKLSPEQWREVERRAASGESTAALAREFGVSRSTVSDRVSVISDRVRETAHQLAAAQDALAALPTIQQQHAAMSIAEKLRNISNGAIDAAETGVKTMALMHRKAYTAAKMVSGHSDVETIRGVAMLLKTGNEAGQPAFNLLSANKERVQRLDEPGEQAMSLSVSFAAPTTERNATDA